MSACEVLYLVLAIVGIAFGFLNAFDISRSNDYIREEGSLALNAAASAETAAREHSYNLVDSLKKEIMTLIISKSQAYADMAGKISEMETDMTLLRGQGKAHAELREQMALQIDKLTARAVADDMADTEAMRIRVTQAVGKQVKKQVRKKR